MVNWAAPQNRGFGERDLYRWICTAGFVQLDVQMLYSIKYCVQAGIGWYRLDLPSVGPRGTSSQQCRRSSGLPPCEGHLAATAADGRDDPRLAPDSVIRYDCTQLHHAAVPVLDLNDRASTS
jgi:hypothetical protein